MTVRIRSGEEQVAIYMDGTSVTVYAILLAIGCAAFAVLFFYISHARALPWAFGGVYLVAGALILSTLPKWVRRIKTDNGWVLLEADKTGVSIAPSIGMARASYSWTDVSQIVLARKLTTKESSERTFSRNQVILCFRSENVREKAIWRTPKGRNVAAVDFPEGEMDRVKSELARFFSDGDVQMFSEVVFDYAKNTENFEP